MRLLMISTDRSILEEGSAARARMVEYGRLVEELHIVIFGRHRGVSQLQIGDLGLKISENVWAYPTNSYSRWLYIFDAYRLGVQILKSKTCDLPARTTDSVQSGGQSLVSVQDPFETGLVGAFLKRRFDLPLQIQLHTDFLSPYFARQSFLNRTRVVIARFVLKRADSIRAVSQRIKDSLLNSAICNLQPAIAVLPVFVNASRFAQGMNAGNTSVIPPFPHTILVVSRLAREKNVDLAIRAFAAIAGRFTGTGLSIVGVGPEAPRLESLARALKLEESITFRGSLPPQALPAVCSNATCFLSTSNYEGYGMALVEAASAALPIVTTDVGIVGEILHDGESALVCPVGDEACLADQLAKLLDDSLLRQRLGEAAARAVRGHAMTKEAYLQKMQSGWKQCMTSA